MAFTISEFRVSRFYLCTVCFQLLAVSGRLQGFLPCFRVFVSRACIKQNHSFVRLDPSSRSQFARSHHGRRSFGRREFPSRVQHFVVRYSDRRSVGLPQHAQNQLIPQRPGNAQTRSNRRRVWKKLRRALMRLPCPHDRCATFRLHGHHTRPLRANPSHGLHLVKRFAHPDQPHASASGIKNHIWQLPAKLFPHLVTHRFLAFHAVRLFQRRNVIPSFAVFVLRHILSAIRDQSVQLYHPGAKRLALHYVRRRRVCWHHDHGGDSSHRRIRCQRASRVSCCRRCQGSYSQLLSARHRRRHTARFERTCRVQSFVLDIEVLKPPCSTGHRRAQPLRMYQRRHAFS